MTPSSETDFRAHAIEAYPQECCGLVVRRVDGYEFYKRCRNLAATPQEHFIVDPQDRADAEDAGEIIAVAHSHPNVAARPSQADKVMCEKSGLEWFIVHVSRDPDTKIISSGEMVSFKPEGYVAPLLGRTFSHGVLDCYSLIRDYYKQQLDIELPNYERRDDWWVHGDDLYMRHFRDAGFEQITDGIKENDVIIMQIRAKQPNHAGVYIGGGLVLQHMANRLSTRDVYDGYFRQVTRLIVRRVQQ